MAARNVRKIPFAQIFDNEGGQLSDVDRDLLDSLGWGICESRGNTAYFSHRSSVSKKTFMHRMVMARVIGRPLERAEFVDHINGNTLDNRRENLRVCSNAENLRNRRKPPSDNKSGVMGVMFCKQTGKWAAELRLARKKIWLGRHVNFDDAVRVRREAEQKYWGEFAPKWGNA